MHLRDKLGRSILNMGIQRVLDLVSLLLVTALVVRSLTRQEYGRLSIVLSYGLVFNLLNISVSAVLVRDYRKVKERIAEYMDAFVRFALIKGAVVVLASAIIGVLLYRRYQDPGMLVVLVVSAATTVALFVTEPFTTLLSVDFRQSILVKINAVSSLANVALSAGAILVPTAVFVAAKNGMVALIGLTLTVSYARNVFSLGLIRGNHEWRRLIKESLVGFSLWSHLMGITTDVIYRADLLILGWVGAPFRVVGNYNIALQMANFTKLLPQILQYNATLGLGHTDDARRRDEITFLFVKYSFLLSAATIVGYLLLGKVAIRLLAGSEEVDHIYQYGLYIIAGLCLFNTFRPLVSYATAIHDIRACFLFAVLPSGVGTLLAYAVMGRLWGADGLAKANLVGGALMTLFTLAHIHWRTEFKWRFAVLTDAEREMLSRLNTRFRT